MPALSEKDLPELMASMWYGSGKPGKCDDCEDRVSHMHGDKEVWSDEIRPEPGKCLLCDSDVEPPNSLCVECFNKATQIMPQSRDRKEFYINMDHCSVEEIKDFVNKLTPEKPLLFNAPIKFITEVRESAAWMDSGGYLHAVPKENKK